MKCPKCQFENRDGIKFCEQCGAAMEVECPNCGAILPLGVKFCGECGNRIDLEVEITEPSIASERKQVTVLFSDLSGFTAMSERLDP